MYYSEIVKVYEDLASTTKRLEKTKILAEFLKNIENPKYIYLLKGKISPDYDSKEFGISNKLVIKAISKTAGVSEETLIKKLRKIGDLGELAEQFVGKKKQTTLFQKKIDVEKVFTNLQKLVEIEGKGSIERKLGYISELLNSASEKEAKYIVRTILSDLRIGVAEGTIRDSLAEAFFPEEKMAPLIEYAYDLSNDLAKVLGAAKKGKDALKKISITPGQPMKVMLPIKVTNIKEAFRICGTPAAIEHKYDGFRVLINKDQKGKITLFTRRLEEVTNQFPDVVKTIKNNVKANSFILDSEVVGYNPKTKKYLPFEAISQRIRRKYEIERLEKTLPVEINVFDIIYHNEKTTMQLPFKERRKILEKIITPIKFKIRPSFQLVVNNEKDAKAFYKKALKIGEEGIMIKKLDAPYHPGRRTGYIVKMKPDTADLDLVITGAEYGSGKRAGWLTSYIVACKSEDKFLEVGKVSSGLKEKQEEGTTYEEMTSLLKPLIIKEKGKTVSVKPKIVVSITYQNIQGSPSYDSGYALRFPRITNYRPDRKPFDIATLKELLIDLKKQRTNIQHIR